MNRTTFFLGLTIPFMLLGVAMSSIISFDLGVKILQYLLLMYLPVLMFIRMKSVGLTTKEMVLTFIPIYGMKYRYKVFTAK